MIGDEAVIRSEFDKQNVDVSPFEIVHTDQAIGMDESPTRALLQKPRSTINLGLAMVKEKKLDGFVSAGNTGAMLVSWKDSYPIQSKKTNHAYIGITFPDGDSANPAPELPSEAEDDDADHPDQDSVSLDGIVIVVNTEGGDDKKN